MAARADILGDTGANAPEHWVGGLAGDDLHAIAILFARNDERAPALHRGARQAARPLRRRAQPVVPRPERHSTVQLRPRPLRLPRPAVAAGDEGLRRGADAGFRRGAGTGRVHPRLSRRERAGGQSPSARGAVAQRQLHGLSPAAGARRRRSATICASTPRPPKSRNCSRRSSWAAGAAARRWCWHRSSDDPELGADPMRNNDFNYKEMDPLGYACPLGSHARRLNPRDTAHYMNRRRMIRRGATYGPALPEGAPDDGVDRGIAAFIICADLVRQFEFAQNVWINDKSVPRTRQRARPDLRHPGRHTGLHRPEAPDPQGAQGPSGVHHPDGRRVLLPARNQRPALPRHARQLKDHHEHTAAGPHLQPEPRRRDRTPAAGASASTGPGAIPGKPNATRPRWRTASPR